MSIRLVVVDDAPFIQSVLKNLLEKNGFEVIGEASDGHTAVEIVLQTKPDIVLMDLALPGKSGIEATKEILSKQPNIKIIACSTFDDESIIMNTIEAGCCDYIVKPFTTKRLLEAIKSTEIKNMQQREV